MLMVGERLSVRTYEGSYGAMTRAYDDQATRLQPIWVGHPTEWNYRTEHKGDQAEPDQEFPSKNNGNSLPHGR